MSAMACARCPHGLHAASAELKKSVSVRTGAEGQADACCPHGAPCCLDRARRKCVGQNRRGEREVGVVDGIEGKGLAAVRLHVPVPESREARPVLHGHERMDELQPCGRCEVTALLLSMCECIDGRYPGELAAPSIAFEREAPAMHAR